MDVVLSSELPFHDLHDPAQDCRMGFLALPCDDTDQDMRRWDLMPVFTVPLSKVERNHIRDENATKNFVVTSTMQSIRSSAPKYGRKRLKPLGKLLELPNELLLAILDYLHPIDLLHLTQTSRQFHQLLLSSGFQAIWADSFKNTDGAPVPHWPLSMSPYEWIRFVFGPPVCNFCGRNYALPDFILLQRLCSLCLENLTVQVPPQLTSLVPGTFRRLGYLIRGEGDVRNNFLLQIAKVIHKINSLAETGAIEEYLTEQRELVTTLTMFADECEEWMEDIQDTQQCEESVRLEQFVDKISCRLVHLGHLEEDVTSTYHDIWETVTLPWRRNYRLSGRLFRRLRPRLEPLVENTKSRRLINERLVLLRTRRDVVRTAFYEYKRTCLPATWPYFPPLYTVYSWPEFDRLINDPSDSNVDRDTLVLADEIISRHVEEWTQQKMYELASLLPRNAQSDPDSLDLRTLDLATSVFTCLGSSESSYKGGRSLIGWEDAGAHLRCGSLEIYWDKRLHISERGQRAAASLAYLAGKDPVSILAREMDELPLRFLCQGCPGHGMKGRPTMGWRQSVLHFIDKVDDGHKNPCWHMLTPEAVAWVKRREIHDPSVTDLAWMCNHCPAHFEEKQERRQVIEHLKKKHDLDKWHAVENLDYVYFRGVSRTEHLPIYIHENAEYQCVMCPNSSRKTYPLYTMARLTQHLQDKHHASHLIMGEHYNNLRIILRSTTVQIQCRDILD